MTVLLSSLYFQLVCLVIILGASSPANAIRGPGNCLPTGYSYYPSIGVAYKVSSDRLSWNQARANCINNGATLGAIDTINKVRIVSNLKHNSNDYVWTSMSRSYRNAPWINFGSYSSVPVLPWLRGSPKIATFWAPFPGNCVAVGQGIGLTNKICTRRLNYVCEITQPDCN